MLSYIAVDSEALVEVSSKSHVDILIWEYFGKVHSMLDMFGTFICRNTTVKYKRSESYDANFYELCKAIVIPGAPVQYLLISLYLATPSRGKRCTIQVRQR